MPFCKDPDITEFKYLITVIRQSNAASDGLGGYTKQFTELGKTRAKIKFSSVKDRVTGEVLGTASEATITVRKSVPIDKFYRVNIAGSDAQYECIGCNPENPMSNFKECYFRRVEHEKA